MTEKIKMWKLNNFLYNLKAIDLLLKASMFTVAFCFLRLIVPLFGNIYERKWFFYTAYAIIDDFSDKCIQMSENSK